MAVALHTQEVLDHASAIKLLGDVSDYMGEHVYRYRIGVHNIGLYAKDEISRNHVLIIHLLGGKICVRIDMTTSETWYRVLKVQRFKWIAAARLIKHVDIDAARTKRGRRRELSSPRCQCDQPR